MNKEIRKCCRCGSVKAINYYKGGSTAQYVLALHRDKKGGLFFKWIPISEIKYKGGEPPKYEEIKE